MLRSCATWCAAIQAVPALWPGIELYGEDADWVGASDAWEESIGSDTLQQVLRETAAANKKLLQRAAGLDALTWRVRITRCYDEPTLAHALLAVLPATLRQLKLEIQCFNPLFLLLRRFPRLESFSIGGSWNANGAELQWDSRAAAAVLPKLTSLRLEFRGEVEQEGNFVINDAPISAMPATWPPALAAATRLSSLELRAAWSTEVSQLCVALPA
ncbi:hypothetical protein COHA_007537 [Chlorella ohadii]|uniref:Uncharacterized protein n=1 Tax=Chlorella ohadii TaxID=2649997 RepID=A0AAD5DM84_9CHLO|nr:hypothetical protein COHA_007537 [Chlorella ohadii]